MFGVLTIAVRIYHDRWGYGVYSGPIGTAVLAITVKWVRGEGLGGALQDAGAFPAIKSFLPKVQLLQQGD